MTLVAVIFLYKMSYAINHTVVPNKHQSSRIVSRSRCHLLLLAAKKRIHGGRELFASLEEFEFEDEDETQEVTTHFLDQFTSRVCGSACDALALCVQKKKKKRKMKMKEKKGKWGMRHTSSNNIIDNNHFLPRLNRPRLHLEKILPILFIIPLGLTRPRQLPLLAHRHKARAQSQGQAGPDQKAAGLETHDDIGLLATGGLEDVQFQGAQEGFVDGGVGEDGEDVFEEDAGGWEVGELT